MLKVGDCNGQDVRCPRNWSLRVVALLTALIAGQCFAGTVWELWDLPNCGLVRLPLPNSIGTEGALEILADGQKICSQELPEAGFCFINPSDEQRKLSRTKAIRIEVERKGGGSVIATDKMSVAPGTHLSPTPTLHSNFERVEVVCGGATIVFDAKKKGGLPSSIVWPSGKRIDSIGWGDRVYGAGKAGGSIVGCKTAEVYDFGAGPIFRHVRTVAWFEKPQGRCAGEPKAVYDWLFFNDNPGWAMVHVRCTEKDGTPWDQVHTIQMEFPFDCFTDSAVAVKPGEYTRVKLPRDGQASRPTSKIMAGLLNGKDYVAVGGDSVCVYTDPNRQIDYLHGSYGSAYGTNWKGEPLTRTAYLRIGTADYAVGALKEPAPVKTVYGKRQVIATDKVSVAPGDGEKLTEVRSGNLRVVTAVIGGTHAAIKSVKANGTVLAVGPQQLFSVAVECIETTKVTRYSSMDEWSSVTAWQKGGSTYWRFKGLKDAPELKSLVVTVKATPTADGGIDWSFGGLTGSRDYALSEATVGALVFLCSGRGMRAVWPGCMGEKALIPCNDRVKRNGKYPSMGCVMQWQAVWDEDKGRCFLMAALDPAGGAKYIRMTGNSDDATVQLAIRHELAWDGLNPGGRSVMSGTISWREFAGDWYEAALYYRDWARENAVFHPKMGPEGRVTTPMWFKNLGYIVKTWGSAQGTEDSVKKCRDYLGVPVMAHWYYWFPGGFDNDYPHYYPPNPDVKDAVKRLHAGGSWGVPYTNGHIWDMHDRGAEDWHFTRYGAYGACRRPDGSIYTERYRSVETNGERVVFAAMCPASRTWSSKVVENCGHVVNDCGFDGYYMDQVGAFSTCVCRNLEHDHPFGGGSWWQTAYRTLLKDARAQCEKPVFLATEGNSEHALDQIDAFVCWNIPGGIDTVPAFEVCYSGAATVYCRSPSDPVKRAREMRMKLANTLVDGDMFGWMPASYCDAKELNAYFRACIRFRQKNAEWFYKGEMRRPPALLDEVPEWDEIWSIFGSKRAVKMPIVQTAARRILDYDYDAQGNRLWRTGRVKKAIVYFTNFSADEKATSRVKFDAKDLGVDLDNATIMRVDAEGVRTPLARADLDKPFDFAPDCCFGIEFTAK